MAATQPEPVSLVERLARRARRIILFERVWPAVALAAAILAVFVAVSWLGLWTALPRAARAAGVIAFGACIAAGLVATLRGLRVSRAEALRRLDRDSGLPHRPLSASEDTLANASDDPVTQALWARSRRQIETVARGVRLARPSPRLADRDPFALRMMALLALVAAGFVAGPEKEGLVEAAFDWRGALPGGPGERIDVWIDPPGYTGRPPVVLAAANQKPQGAGPLSAPVHSTIVVRASGAAALDVKAGGGIKVAADKATQAGTKTSGGPADQVERRLVLDGDGTLTVTHAGTTIGPLAITAVPDQPPTIALVGKPEPTARGGLTLAYTIADDYGVTGAEAAFSDPAPPDTARMVRSLVPAPKLALGLPPAPGGLGKGQTTGDLSDSPWAGSVVTLVLSTHDEGGNTGLSAPVRITLPGRPFHNPLARALVEQRQNLVFDPDHHGDVGLALDALMIDPDQFGTSKPIYLGLYTARQRLAAAHDDDDLIALSDYLWQIALKVEDGELGKTARDLRAAEQALREALQRGAPPDEIKRLTEALREQMDKFMAEMQRNAQPDKQARADAPTRMVTQQQLQAMMKKMQDLAEKGDTAEAQRMLDQLQAMMDNLRTAQQGSAADQAQRELNRDMNDLQKMARDQQALRDKTFKNGQRARRQDGQQGDADPEDAAPDAGQQPQQDQQADGEDLAGQQQALRERLEQLQKSMRELGMRGEQGLADAEQAMKDAEGALGKGPSGNRNAVDAQGRALQGLQKGTDGMSQQMAQGQSDQPGEGQGEGGQSGQGASGASGDDPLGRRRDGRGNMEVRGNALDEGVAARAQQVLQELRKRLANPNRPTDELDYLERLLQSN